MNRRYPWEFPKPVPKQPPPEHGIKMKQAGATWWGQRWIEALTQVLSGDAGRLARGRTYARAGRTHDLMVTAGKVTAQVTGSRAKPYEVAIELACFDDRVWKKAIAGMAAKAQFSAELLAGQMPQRIDEVFRAAGKSLLPMRRADLVTSCTCPDWGDPCKHVAATHYVLGEAFDRDPFLLFELRGRKRDELLHALRDARSARGAPRDKRRAAAPAEVEDQADAGALAHAEIPTVKLGRIAPADYDRARAPLPSLQFSFDEPVAHGAVLRQLGAPAAWSREDSPAELLAPAVRAAAEAARRIALAAPQATQRAAEPEEPCDKTSSTVATRYALLLRGVNVGTKNSLPMAELRAMLEKAGCTGVRTYVQSGNAVFATKLGTIELTRALERALERYMRRPIGTTLRTRAQLAAIVDANPFADVATNPTYLCVTFLSQAPTESQLAPVSSRDFAPELMHASGTEIYTWRPNGQGRSPLAAALNKLALPGTATTRNWNTVLKLLEMLSEE